MAGSARACGITRQAAYLWLKNDPEFREKIAVAREEWCDVAETKLLALIASVVDIGYHGPALRGHPWSRWHSRFGLPESRR